MLTVGILCLLFVPTRPASAQLDPIVIQPGFDCFATECGRTHMSFCGADGTAIPADFFDIGSDPFEGEIQFRGLGGPADTQVERFDQMVLPDIETQAQTAIELVQLDLVSCAPITVMIEGQPTEWDVAATLSKVPAGQGLMMVDRTHLNGGLFHSDFPLFPLLTFTRVLPPMEDVVLDTGLVGLPIQFSTVGQEPWVSVVTIPAGLCSLDFAPGVEEDPMTMLQCCVKVGHDGPGHIHETGPPDCSGCMGACCDPATGACGVSTEAACDAGGGDYKGHGSDCVSDADGDGIPDVLESNSCCAANDSCNTGTDPNNRDTDGDGIPDGAELAGGTDPCVADVIPIFEDGFESGDVLMWSATGGG